MRNLNHTKGCIICIISYDSYSPWCDCEENYAVCCHLMAKVSYWWGFFSYEMQPPFDPASGCSHLQEGAGVVAFRPAHCYACLAPSRPLGSDFKSPGKCKRREVIGPRESWMGGQALLCWKNTTIALMATCSSSTHELRACKAVKQDIHWYLLFTLWAQLFLHNWSYSLSPYHQSILIIYHHCTLDFLLAEGQVFLYPQWQT